MARPFVLSAEQTFPPVLNSAVYVLDNDPEQTTISLLLEGNDPDSNTVGYSSTL